ncbi:MAG TPA: SPOR domain-containing protein [Methylomirabilota bacterium]
MAGDPEGFDEETSRSIFSAFWFRAVLVVIALGIVAVIAVPYVLDVMSSRPDTVTGSRVTPAPTPTPSPPAPVTPPAPAPSTQAPSVPVPQAATTEPSKTEAAKTESARPEATAPDAPKPEMAKPAEPAPPAKAPEPERSTARPDGASKVVASKPAAKSPMARPKAAAASGPYWVQVGAFREAAAAKQVADKLRADNYSVEESTKPGSGRAASAAQSPSASPGGDRYNVFVSGATPADVSAKVGAKGFNAEAVAGGVAVRPSLSLKEAVELSRELAGEGMKVQVRRAAAESGKAATPAAAAATGETWYRVRVGSFPDKAAAVAALKELEGKGYKPFLARGAR